MESKYKDLPQNKTTEEDNDDLYEDDPEFEKIANNDEEGAKKD